MGATQDPKLAQETLDYILTKARDQDLHSFFRGLQSNIKTRRLLAKFFMEQLDVVSILQ
jgi:aminopeptidase 2